MQRPGGVLTSGHRKGWTEVAYYRKTPWACGSEELGSWSPRRDPNFVSVSDEATEPRAQTADERYGSLILREEEGKGKPVGSQDPGEGGVQPTAGIREQNRSW